MGIAYVMNQLQDNGFYVKYTHPNLLFISWKHYLDKRQRMNFKKTHGYSIDAFGNPLGENTEEVSSNDVADPNNFILKKDDKKYKKISSYNPTGNLIYNSNLLKQIEEK